MKKSVYNFWKGAVANYILILGISYVILIYYFNTSRLHLCSADVIKNEGNAKAYEYDFMQFEPFIHTDAIDQRIVWNAFSSKKIFETENWKPFTKCWVHTFLFEHLFISYIDWFWLTAVIDFIIENNYGFLKKKIPIHLALTIRLIKNIYLLKYKLQITSMRKRIL